MIRIKKLLIFGIIALFIYMGIQPAFANNININTEEKSGNNDSSDLGLSFILCEVYHFHYIFRIARFAFFVKFELRDLDSGDIIQEKYRLFGIHLFTGLQRGKNYEITVTSKRGFDTIIVKDIDFFNFETLVIIVT